MLMTSELFFMLVVLKIPVVFICGVVWWAIRAEPRPFEDAFLAVEAQDFGSPGAWRRRSPSRPRRPGPHGAPARRAARSSRTRSRSAG